ncbi:MAG TPA: glycosyltransferase family 39 protein [Blastocatellia bacterium]|nr:glycosyltransferase family 39 protein [Blastocatellia bacterium]
MTSPPDPPSSHSCAKPYAWKRDHYIWLPLACVSWLLAWRFQDQFISDWDGFDYTVYAVQHRASALGLSRALFLAYNSALWEIAHHWFGLLPEKAYLVIRYGVITQAGPAIIGVYALCKELTSSRLAAFFGALIVLSSPFYIIYSGRGMSEIPGLLALSWSLWWMLRSLRTEKNAQFLMAACLVGLSANIREFAVFYLPFIPIAARIYIKSWMIGCVALVLAVICAFAGMIFWKHYDDLYWVEVVNWYRLSAAERKVHPVTSANLWFLAQYSFNCSAVATIISPFALVWLWAKRRMRLPLALGLVGLAADLALLANHDLSINPRYLLTGLIGLAAVSGWLLAESIRCFRVWAAPLLIGLIVLTGVSYNNTAKELYNQQWSARAARDYVAKVAGLPWNSAFIVGSRTPLVHFLAGVKARPFWVAVTPGAPWPDERLDEVIQGFLYAGREVYVDFDPEVWQAGARERSREAAGLEMIKRDFSLEHIRDSFYRVLKRAAESPENPKTEQSNSVH